MSDDRNPATLEEWMRLAYGTEAGCPPPTAFLEAERNRAGREATEKLEAHLARCPACAAERDLAGAFDGGPSRQEDLDFVVARLERMHPAPASSTAPGVEETGGRSSTVVPLRRPERRRGLPAAWRLAAAAAVVLAVGWVLMRDTPPELPGGAGPGGEVRGAEIELLSPVGDLESLPGELRWAAHSSATTYRVRLFTVQGDSLWEATVPGSSTPIPEEIGRRIHRAVVYSWEVEALDNDDNLLARSSRTRFRALPRGEDDDPSGDERRNR